MFRFLLIYRDFKIILDDCLMINIIGFIFVVEVLPCVDKKMLIMDMLNSGPM